MPDNERSKFLKSLAALLQCHIVYMYFLDFNVVTLLLRVMQYVIVQNGTRERNSRSTVTFAQKAIFLWIVIFSNFPVLFIHLSSNNLQPIILNFIGTVKRSHTAYLLLMDLLVIALEGCMILNKQFLHIFR